LRIAVGVLCAFAALWCYYAILVAGLPQAFIIVPVLTSIALTVLVRDGTLQSSSERKRRNRIVGWASGAEAVAIVLALAFLPQAMQRDWAGSIVVVIVGLHLLPMARYLPYPRYYPVGAALVVLGVAGLLIYPPVTRAIVTGFGAAAILWICAATMLGRDNRSLVN
jgi:hypothetical protein